MNLSTDTQNKLKIYQENFEKAYIESSREFYHSRASAYLAENGIVNYMKYVSDIASYASSVASRVLCVCGCGCCVSVWVWWVWSLGMACTPPLVLCRRSRNFKRRRRELSSIWRPGRDVSQCRRWVHQGLCLLHHSNSPFMLPFSLSPPLLLPSPLQLLDSVVEVLVTAHQGIMAAVCPRLISENETESESRDRSGEKCRRNKSKPYCLQLINTFVFENVGRLSHTC